MLDFVLSKKPAYSNCTCSVAFFRWVLGTTTSTNKSIYLLFRILDLCKASSFLKKGSTLKNKKKTKGREKNGLRIIHVRTLFLRVSCIFIFF